MRKLSVLIITFFLIIHSAFPQKEKNNWFFGQNCGLDFSISPPMSISGGMNTLEGCASISDKDGNLLFYTDGITIFNSPVGAIMPGGTGLLGSNSSTSSSIIVPKPCSKTEYYIFTIDDITGTNGLNYTLVNMDTDGDCFYNPLTEQGAVVTGMKNINLPGPTGEKICAIKHSNGLDYWIIATKKNSSDFYVYGLTPAGIVPGPNSLSIGPLHNAYGYLKASKSGNLLAMASSSAFGSAKVLLYDFDPSTGIITHKHTIAPNRELIYGVEFSNNENYLYFTSNDLLPTLNGKDVFSFDLTNLSKPPSVIYTSPDIPLVFPNHTYANLGAAQMAPDGKIYIAKGRTPYLDAIADPDFGGTNYQVDAITLTDTSFIGLPTFVAGNVKSCKPLDMQGYKSAVPDLFNQTIKNLITTDGIQGMDKEFGDIDSDGDVDILFTINNNLNVLLNSGGYCSTPVFTPSPNNLNINILAYSYKLIDWDNDGANDLIIHGTIPSSAVNGIFLYLNNGLGAFPSSPTQQLLQDIIDFPFEQLQLIEVGDLNHDNLPDLLISGNNKITGTHYYENNGLGGLNKVGLIIAGTNASYPCPELYDADCKNGLDVLVSNPLYGNPITGGARMYFHENKGGLPTLGLPPLDLVGVTNPFGFNDILQSVNSDFMCDWVITRIVDFFNDDCPIAISYNPCNNSLFFYYQQNCVCSDRNFVTSLEELGNPSGYDVELYPNPTNDIINIRNYDNLDIQQIKIMSIEGKLLKQFAYINQGIQVSNLEAGLYFMIIQSKQGIITKEFLVQ